MAIIEIESKVYKVEDKVAEKILDMSYKIEELEMEVRKLKKDVLDEEIHWHSQKQKRLAEKRKKLKYKQRIDKANEFILDLKNNLNSSLLGHKEYRDYLIDILNEIINIINGE